MLIFFIHGVATSSSKYANNLKELIKQEFIERGESLPHFYAGFWGDVLNDLGKVWNWVHEDLQAQRAENSKIDAQDIFRYQEFRQGFLSDFIGDALTYLNSDRGKKIRGLIADQLEDFINQHPQESELHVIAHSLGTIILWDSLFSERFPSNDPAFKIRAMFKGQAYSTGNQKLKLKSISTMGSPILLFNLMLGTSPEILKSFFEDFRSQEEPLRWLNIIHASDVIAYPIRASLKIDSSWNLLFKDTFINTDANPIEKSIRKMTNSSIVQTLGRTHADVIACAPMVMGAGNGHTSYWQCLKTADLITDNVLDNLGQIFRNVINHLKKIPGVTEHADQPSDSLFDQTLLNLKFKDGSGRLQLLVNPVKIHHVFVFDSSEVYKFGGYFGWIHTDELKGAIDYIKASFC